MGPFGVSAAGVVTVAVVVVALAPSAAAIAPAGACDAELCNQLCQSAQAECPDFLGSVIPGLDAGACFDLCTTIPVDEQGQCIAHATPADVDFSCLANLFSQGANQGLVDPVTGAPIQLCSQEAVELCLVHEPEPEEEESEVLPLGPCGDHCVVYCDTVAFGPCRGMFAVEQGLDVNDPAQLAQSHDQCLQECHESICPSGIDMPCALNFAVTIADQVAQLDPNTDDYDVQLHLQCLESFPGHVESSSGCPHFPLPPDGCPPPDPVFVTEFCLASQEYCPQMQELQLCSPMQLHGMQCSGGAQGKGSNLQCMLDIMRTHPPEVGCDMNALELACPNPDNGGGGGPGCPPDVCDAFCDAALRIFVEAPWVLDGPMPLPPHWFDDQAASACRAECIGSGAMCASADLACVADVLNAYLDSNPTPEVDIELVELSLCTVDPIPQPSCDMCHVNCEDLLTRECAPFYMAALGLAPGDPALEAEARLLCVQRCEADLCHPGFDLPCVLDFQQLVLDDVLALDPNTDDYAVQFEAKCQGAFPDNSGPLSGCPLTGTGCDAPPPEFAVQFCLDSEVFCPQLVEQLDCEAVLHTWKCSGGVNGDGADLQCMHDIMVASPPGEACDPIQLQQQCPHLPPVEPLPPCIDPPTCEGLCDAFFDYSALFPEFQESQPLLPLLATQESCHDVCNQPFAEQLLFVPLCQLWDPVCVVDTLQDAAQNAIPPGQGHPVDDLQAACPPLGIGNPPPQSDCPPQECQTWCDAGFAASQSVLDPCPDAMNAFVPGQDAEMRFPERWSDVPSCVAACESSPPLCQEFDLTCLTEQVLELVHTFDGQCPLVPLALGPGCATNPLLDPALLVLPPAAQEACSIYCQVGGLACTGRNALHRDEATCILDCGDAVASGLIPVHPQSDDARNSLTCRHQQLLSALYTPSDAVLSCAEASLTCSGTCAYSPCDELCTAVLRECHGGLCDYATMQQCLDTCRGWATGSPGDTRGNTQQCRLTHMRDSSSTLRERCAAAGSDGGGVCVDACSSHSECASGVCFGGWCRPPSCSDGVRNGGEAGVDCGGSCTPCSPPDGGCQENLDECPNPVHCFADPCTVAQNHPCNTGGRTCVPSYCGGCFTNWYEGNTLVCSDCDDEPPVCDPQACASGVCDADGTCADPTCNDGVRNGGETGVDCGGPSCDPCNPPPSDGCATQCDNPVSCIVDPCSIADNHPCNKDGRTCVPSFCGGCYTNWYSGDLLVCSDCDNEPPQCDPQACASGVCDADGTCADPTCNDGVRNGGETGVDCGGPDCDPCNPPGDDSGNGGDPPECQSGDECASRVCSQGVCQDPTCSDGARNGFETGVDCGGPECVPCACVPDCTGIECGGDGCGGVCGTCAPGAECDAGSCVAGPPEQDCPCLPGTHGECINPFNSVCYSASAGGACPAATVPCGSARANSIASANAGAAALRDPLVAATGGVAVAGQEQLQLSASAQAPQEAQPVRLEVDGIAAGLAIGVGASAIAVVAVALACYARAGRSSSGKRRAARRRQRERAAKVNKVDVVSAWHDSDGGGFSGSDDGAQGDTSEGEATRDGHVRRQVGTSAVRRAELV